MNYLAIAAAIAGFITFGTRLIAVIGWAEYRSDRDQFIRSHQ